MERKEDWVRGGLHAAKREIVAEVDTDAILSGARRDVNPAGLAAGASQQAEKRLPIRLVDENVFLPASPAHHMITRTWVFDPEGARHGPFLFKIQRASQPKLTMCSADPFSGCAMVAPWPRHVTFLPGRTKLNVECRDVTPSLMLSPT
jgi:hypothetical protein